MENLYDDNFNIYKAFTTAERELHLSYSSADTEGGALRPSIYITKIKKMFPNLKETSDVIVSDYQITNQKATYDALIEKLAKIEESELEPEWKEIYKYFGNNEEWKIKLEKRFARLKLYKYTTKYRKDNNRKIVWECAKNKCIKIRDI